MQLKRLIWLEGDHIKVTASQYPFPTVCADKQSTDWFHSIARTLKWNERSRQKSFVVVEEDGLADEDETKKAAKQGKRMPKDVAMPCEADNDAEDEQEETYDIDDLSSAETSAPSSPGTTPASSTSTGHKTDWSTSSAGSLGEGSRFAAPVPKPPKLSTRHSWAQTKPEEEPRPSVSKLARSSIKEQSNGDSIAHSGETGDRDHVRVRCLSSERALISITASGAAR